VLSTPVVVSSISAQFAFMLHLCVGYDAQGAVLWQSFAMSCML
jgi:hypothetical protein